MSLVTVSTAGSPLASMSSSLDASRGADAKSATAPTGTASPVSAMSGANVSSTTVSLSAKALGLSQAVAHPTSPAPPSDSAVTTAAAPAGSDDASTYEALKNGLAHGAEDVVSAVGDGVRWVADGIGDVLSGADTLVHGVAELPFAIGAKMCDAAGAVLDAL